jgi:hypothetical protein
MEMLSQGTVPLACRQGGLCPEHTGPVRLDGARVGVRIMSAPNLAQLHSCISQGLRLLLPLLTTTVVFRGCRYGADGIS